MKKLPKIIVTITIIFAAAIVGCTKNPQGRLSIEGTATLDGEPLAEGTISFEPIGEQTLKVRSGALIKSGKYKMPAASGLVPGEYLVQIVSQKETGQFVKVKNDLDGSEENVREIIDLIPPEYSSASTQRITVTENGKQTFDFEIKSNR